MNICMVGHGMMGVWHSNALMNMDCCLHTVVGRRAKPVADFAEQYGYRHWTVDLEEALGSDEIDIVILANPSEIHAETALLSLDAGKHTLVEIPIAMNLADAQVVTDKAQKLGLKLGVVHPMRVRPEMAALRNRVVTQEESVRQIVGRFYIHRLRNVGATGYKRSWTDNLLWHHTTHLLDLGLWIMDDPVKDVSSWMPTPDSKTGIPMDLYLGVETTGDRSLVCTGSYYSHENIFDIFIISDRNSYRLDVFNNTINIGSDMTAIAPEPENCALITRDFVESVREGRDPAVTGDSVLPAMTVLQQVQEQWDQIHGARGIPGRP